MSNYTRRSIQRDIAKSMWAFIISLTIAAGPCHAQAPTAEIKLPPGIAASMLEERLNQRMERIEFVKRPLDVAAAEIAQKYRVPVSTELALDRNRKPPVQPTVTVTLGDVTVRQALQVLATCSNTHLEVTYRGGCVLQFCSDEARAWNPNYKQQTKVWQDRFGQPGLSPVAKALAEHTHLRFTDTVLGDALKFIEDLHGVVIVRPADKQLLEKTVNLDVERIPLRAALVRLLGPLKLKFVVDGDTLRLVSPEQLEQDIFTQLYRLPAVGEDQLPLRDPARTFRDALAKVDATAPAEVELIDGCLIITGTIRHHLKVERLFELLEDAAKK